MAHWGVGVGCCAKNKENNFRSCFPVCFPSLKEGILRRWRFLYVRCDLIVSFPEILHC